MRGSTGINNLKSAPSDRPIQRHAERKKLVKQS
jgi:hypothetical protein